MICKFSLIYFGNGFHILFERQRFKTGIYRQGGGVTGARDLPPFLTANNFNNMCTVDSLHFVGANFCGLSKFYRFMVTLFVYSLKTTKEIWLYYTYLLIRGGCCFVRGRATNSTKIQPPRNLMTTQYYRHVKITEENAPPLGGWFLHPVRHSFHLVQQVDLLKILQSFVCTCRYF